MPSTSSNTPGRAAARGGERPEPDASSDDALEAAGSAPGPWRLGIRRTLAQARAAVALRGPGASPPPFWAARSPEEPPPAPRRGAPSALGALAVRLLLPAVRDGGPASLLSTAIAGVPVASARVLRLDGPRAQSDLDDGTLELDFGPVSEAQFLALRAALGGRSAVPYAPGRSYAFFDFLPPAAQAVLGRGVLAPEPVALEGTGPLRSDLRSEQDLVVSLSPNSHGATWELVRAYQDGSGAPSFAFYYLDPLLLRRALESPRRFTRLAAVDAVGAGADAPPAAVDLVRSLRPGDVVAYFRRGPDGLEDELLHSAVAAGAGLFLEKPDAEADELAETAYRLVGLEHALPPLLDRLGGARPELRAYRPVAPLRPAAEVFKTPMQAALEAWACARGCELGRPLLTEYWIGTSGGVIGEAVTAVDERPVDSDQRGRGVLG